VLCKAKSNFRVIPESEDLFSRGAACSGCFGARSMTCVTFARHHLFIVCLCFSSAKRELCAPNPYLVPNSTFSNPLIPPPLFPPVLRRSKPVRTPVRCRALFQTFLFQDRLFVQSPAPFPLPSKMGGVDLSLTF